MQLPSPTPPEHAGTLGGIAAIGTLNEGSLHAALKARYRTSAAEEEVEMGSYVVDLVDGDRIIEIQTGSFSALGRKLDHLLSEHPVLVVHPIAHRITLSRQGMADRKSPKRGRVHDVFDELVSLPSLLDHPNFSLEVAMIEERRVKVHDPALRRRRGGWRTVDRQLLDVVEVHRFDGPQDIELMLPEELPDRFTTADMCAGQSFSRSTAQKMAYCLRAMDRIEVVDRTKAGYVYRRAVG